METAHHKRTAGNYSLSGPAGVWQDLDSSTDLEIHAHAGDLLKIGVSARSGPESVNVGLDAATIIGGIPVNYVGGSGSSADFGVSGWIMNNGAVTAIGATVTYEVKANDIFDGKVKIRLRWKPAQTNISKTMNASSVQPFQWFVTNEG